MEAGDGDPADAIAGAHTADARRRSAVHLDDRPAGADDLLFARCITACSIRAPEQFVGLENFRYFLTDPAFLASLQNTLVLVGSVLAITILARHSAGAAARSAGDRPQHRAADGDRAVLRHADGERAGLEEPPDASGLRTVRLDRDAGSA